MQLNDLDFWHDMLRDLKEPLNILTLQNVVYVLRIRGFLFVQREFI